MPMSKKEIIIALRDQGMLYQDIARIAKVSEVNARSICSRAYHQNDTQNDGMCRYCGVKLINTAGKKQKQFCSDKCRYDWHNQHKLYIRVCEYCGKEFVSFGYPNKRFCSRSCRTLHERKGDRNE